ncbi:hypothetical protein GH807_13980 [Acetobacterium tundrae]|uniref:Uncharacterized protein n=1 Tax=Acetobacterium tundrae TaxID=132932 RepID=A0ABR6WPD1_9FIRM|nr:hypothetical protein [Acetobacterium tundrae]
MRANFYDLWLDGCNGLFSDWRDSIEGRLTAIIDQVSPGKSIPYEYGEVKQEIQGYRDSAWIGTFRSFPVLRNNQN